MTYIFLIIIVSILLIISYFLNKKEILSPSIIFLSSYLLSIIFAFIGTKSWNTVHELNSKLIIIYFIGMVSFLIGEFYARRIVLKKKKTLEKKEIQKIDISTGKIIVICLFIIVGIMYIIYDLKKVCLSNGLNTSNISLMIKFYREGSSLFTSSSTSTMSLNFISNQIIKVINVLCVLFMYVYFNNLIIKSKNNTKYLFPIILCFLGSVFTSGRSSMLKFIVSGLMIFFVLMYVKNSDKKNFILKFNKKIFSILAKTAIIILPIFYLLLPLYGRTTTVNMIDYLTFYFGCPTPSFSIFLDHQLPVTEFFGEETFTNIYSLLNKIHVLKYDRAQYLEFIWDFGMGSNVYSSFRRPYVDFGIFGVAVIHFLFGFVFEKMYKKYKTNRSIFFTVFYSYYASHLFDSMRDNAFSAIFLSVNTLIYIILFKIFINFVFFKEFNIDKEKN